MNKFVLYPTLGKTNQIFDGYRNFRVYLFIYLLRIFVGSKTVVWLLPPQCHNTCKHVSDFAICLKETCLTSRKCSNMIMYNVKVDIKAMR